MQEANRAAAILRSLRKTGDEAQLTRVLAAVGEDDDVAGALARILVEATPNETQRAALGALPPVLKCQPEATLKSTAGRDHGRVDLRFDDEAREFTLLVELKLHSAYGHDQVKRYGEALGDLPRDRRSALLAVTRNVPSVGEPAASTDRWLGSLRWTDIYEQLLGLDVRDGDLAREWRLLLGLINDEGDFGVKELDRAEVEGWSAYVRTRRKLGGLIEDLAPKALELVQAKLVDRDAWAGQPKEEVAELRTRGKERKVRLPTQTTVQARFNIPSAEGHERLRIQFLGGFEVPCFTVEARRNGAAALLAGRLPGSEKFTTAVKTLTREHGFKSNERSHVAAVHGPDEWLDSDGERTVGERLLDLIEQDLTLLVDSGILDPDSGFDTDHGRDVDDEEPLD